MDNLLQILCGSRPWKPTAEGENNEFFDSARSGRHSNHSTGQKKTCIDPFSTCFNHPKRRRILDTRSVWAREIWIHRKSEATLRVHPERWFPDVHICMTGHAGHGIQTQFPPNNCKNLSKRSWSLVIKGGSIGRLEVASRPKEPKKFTTCRSSFLQFAWCRHPSLPRKRGSSLPAINNNNNTKTC